jgi:hypothetical protein
MDHPNIARVLDGGATETGRPYFVMDLVQGVPITEFCDKNHLTTEQRLKLFIPVCQAIQSAHQKGIIHRDLKPTNILVSLNPDGSGLPKVIDFGVAKATSQKLTEKTLFTQHGVMIGTPAYMSPEQAEMSHLDVDTRADIYSLGALLYELLSGSPPFPDERLRSAGYNEMQRIIREEQPLKPSTRLSTLQGEQRSIVARNRGESELNLGRSFPGDLDWIVMKCLEKDRARRYETANGLAMDLQRHLADEPVLARPPSRLYKLQKTVRRHWVGFCAAAAVLAALTVGMVLSWRAEKLAKQRLAEAQAISKFLTQVFRSPDPDRDGRTITVAESLGTAAAKLEGELSDQPGRRAKFQETLGLTYVALGLDREAIALQEKVRDYYLATLGPEHPETIGSLGLLANSYWRMGRRDEGVKLQEQVLALFRKVSGSQSEDTLKAMDNLGISYAVAGRTEDASKLPEEALALRRKLNGPEHRGTLEVMQNLAGAYLAADHPDKAAKLLEEVLAIHRRQQRPERPDTLNTMHNLAFAYQALGRQAEAIKLQEQVLPLYREVNGPEHPDTLNAMQNLAVSYFKAGRLDEGIQLGEDLLVLRHKVNRSEHPDNLGMIGDLATAYEEAGRPADALKLRRELLAVRRKVLGPDHPETLRTLNSVAWTLATCEATGLRDGTNAVELAETAAAATYRTNAVFLGTLAAAYAEAQQFDKAVGAQLDAIDLLQSEQEKLEFKSRLKLYQENKPYRVQRKP